MESSAGRCVDRRHVLADLRRPAGRFESHPDSSPKGGFGKILAGLQARRPGEFPGNKEVYISFNPGAKGGIAVREVLFGELKPQGRLTVSFPRSSGLLPVYYNGYKGRHSMNPRGEERYLDGEAEPLFAFGEGLSYTRFAYSDLRVLTPELRPGEEAVVQVDVANAGQAAGTETVQLYIRDLVAPVTTAAKNLRAVFRVSGP